MSSQFIVNIVLNNHRFALLCQNEEAPSAMLDTCAPEEVVVLLVGDTDLEVSAVGLHAVLALLPLHSLALLLSPHLKRGLSLGPVGPLEGGHLLCVAADLVVGDGLGGVTVKCLNLLGHNLVHQFAVLPCFFYFILSSAQNQQEI